MNKPASAPDVIPPREVPPPEPGEASEGSNATQHQPDPSRDRRVADDAARVQRRSYPTGND